MGQTTFGEPLNYKVSQNAAAIEADEEAMAILATGDTHVAIEAGKYVYVRDHSTLARGLYKNTSGSTIAANDPLSSSNLTATTEGGLNELNSNIGTLSALNTTAKTDLVSAINETYSLPCKATIKNVNCSKSAESLVSSVIASGDPVGKIYTGTWTVPGVDAGVYMLLKTTATGGAFGVASFGASTAYVIRNATSWIQV